MLIITGHFSVDILISRHEVRILHSTTVVCQGYVHYAYNRHFCLYSSCKCFFTFVDNSDINVELGSVLFRVICVSIIMNACLKYEYTNVSRLFAC